MIQLHEDLNIDTNYSDDKIIIEFITNILNELDKIKTDTDATFMHMKENHIKNGQLKPGYNIQIDVEGEYIVGVDVSSKRSDQLTLIPFLDKLEKGLPKKFNNFIADAGYESEDCSACPHKVKCTNTKGNKRLHEMKIAQWNIFTIK